MVVVKVSELKATVCEVKVKGTTLKNRNDLKQSELVEEKKG